MEVPVLTTSPRPPVVQNHINDIYWVKDPQKIK